MPRAWIEDFLKVLSPFAPHVADELWSRLGHDGLLLDESWPSWDEEKLRVETVTLAVQVGGKLRATVEVPADVSEEEAIAVAKADEKVARFLEGKTIRREIYVPGRLVNLVAS